MNVILPLQTLENCNGDFTRVDRFAASVETIRLVSICKKALENYASYVFDNDLEPYIRHDILTNLQNHLTRVKEDCKSTKNPAAEAEVLFQELSECGESLTALLLDHKSGKGWIATALALVQSSRALQEIKWKIKKYENLILELSKAMVSMSGDPIKSLAEAIKFPNDYQMMVDANDSKRFTLENLSLLRNIYCNLFMKQLRIQLKEHETDAGILAICYHLYCNISLDDDNQKVLKLFNTWGHKCLEDKQLSSAFTNPEVVEFDYLDQKITAVPDSAKAPYMSKCANSMRGVFNRDFDPGVQGNPIHCLYLLQIGGKEIKSLGFGTPTIEPMTFFNSAELCPEFKAFLTVCKQKGLRHLFIMNQDITSNGYIAAEKQRCDLVMNLQKDESLIGTFFAIALSKNSSFYSQEGKDYLNTNLFIEDLIAQFACPHSGSMIPEEIIKYVKMDFSVIANAIHRKLFNSSPKLEKNERLLFIEAFYDQITKWMILKLGINSFNISCKDAIDRGAASNAQLYAHLAIINDAFTDEHKKRTMVLMMVRALLVRKRGPNRSRVVRFLETLDFYLSHRKELKELHQELFGFDTILPKGI